MSEVKQLASGLYAPLRTKTLCRHCGAAFDKLEGVEQHETQCRARALQVYVAAAMKGGHSDPVTYALDVVAALESRPRAMWEEVSV